MKISKSVASSLVTGLNKFLNIWGLVALRKQSYGSYVIDIWDYNDEFEEIYARIQSVAGVTKRSLFVIYQVLHQVCSVPGDVIECGVYKGGSAYMLADVISKLAPQKSVFLFDTFKGLPDTNADYDTALKRQNKYQDTSVENVKKLLEKFNNYSICEGLFQETLNRVAEKTFCFTHIDCDLYDSIMYCCETLYPGLSTGGIMIFDDYGYTIDWPGAKLAVDKFFSDKKEKPIHLPTGQGLVIKI